MGRPISVRPDLTIVWDLAFLGFSDQHIAEVVGVCQPTFSKRRDLGRVVEEARNERAEAILAAWRDSSQGALRPENRAEELVRWIVAAEQRKIRRQQSEQRKISGESCGEDAQRSAVSEWPFGESERATADRNLLDRST
jgi:hypothetical protein